ncbi:MAG: hypothetical protein M3389_11710 [Actinomycetota bacterium]|nr:hypothetical protein [Actinomycetota bacterium]
MSGGRRLSAVDDPLELGGASGPTPPASSRQLPALFVRLPVAQSDALARAAFELKVHKRELVAALVGRYVASTPEGLAALRELVDDFRRLSG